VLEVAQSFKRGDRESFIVDDPLLKIRSFVLFFYDKNSGILEQLTIFAMETDGEVNLFWRGLTRLSAR